ncbi:MULTISPECIES: hypothetical protein [unclassified Janthinobacterium]|uniref:hypothetical protein n=1 Tax=unclassified Janthinobacterium TaxID=2610881 RepID=UPI0012FD5D51|nr:MULTISPECIES: hypothetical protein [unclassified Janthinobacterium]
MTSKPMSFDAPKGFGAINPPFVATTVDLLNGSALSASRRKLIAIAVTACAKSGLPHAF